MPATLSSIFDLVSPSISNSSVPQLLPNGEFLSTLSLCGWLSNWTSFSSPNRSCPVLSCSDSWSSVLNYQPWKISDPGRLCRSPITDSLGRSQCIFVDVTFPSLFWVVEFRVDEEFVKCCKL